MTGTTEAFVNVNPLNYSLVVVLYRFAKNERILMAFATICSVYCAAAITAVSSTVLPKYFIRKKISSVRRIHLVADFPKRCYRSIHLDSIRSDQIPKFILKQSTTRGINSFDSLHSRLHQEVRCLEIDGIEKNRNVDQSYFCIILQSYFWSYFRSYCVHAC